MPGGLPVTTATTAQGEAPWVLVMVEVEAAPSLRVWLATHGLEQARVVEQTAGMQKVPVVRTQVCWTPQFTLWYPLCPQLTLRRLQGLSPRRLVSHD